MVPEQNLDEVLSFIDGILKRCQTAEGKGKAAVGECTASGGAYRTMPDEMGFYDDPAEEEKALKMMMRASMHDVWETVKDDESDIPDEEIAARHMQAVGLATMWETVKNDTW